MEGIEFTDRYGGNLPSMITGCRRCEAMGCFPTTDQGVWPADAPPPGTPEPDGTPDDGWRFVRCNGCGGTGRVPLRVGLRRVPSLWAGGARFVWDTRTFGVPPGRRRLAWFWVRVKIAFFYDWFLLSRRTARWAR